MNRRRKNHAVRNIFLVTLAAMFIIVSDVFVVAIGKIHLRSGTDLSVYADTANTVVETTKALRGNIYDRYGTVIAQDNRTYNIVCVLDENRKGIKDQVVYVKDKEGTAQILSKILRMDYEKILDYLYLYQKTGAYQTELGENGRKLSKAVKDEIDSYNLPGIEFTDSIQRVYPLGTFASNLIGFAQSDENGSTIGKMGLELYLNGYLSGKDGSRSYQVDKEGYVLPGMKENVVSAVNGNNVYLTIDSGIQSSLEQSFQMSVSRFNIEAAWGAAMEVKTGKVLAWGQYPSFDPNKLDVENYNNIGAQLPYEPGSTLKTFTWAAAINEGKYDGDATTDGNIFCFSWDNQNNPIRSYASGKCKYNARNRQYGEVTYDIGLMKSLNTVAASVQTELITPQIHLDYLKKFGFWQPVDTDGIPEEVGYLNFTWPEDKLSLSYGQGSTVNMLQMLQAYSAIFSDGTMVKPYFVESVRDSYDNSKVIYQAETKVVGNPITPQTAKQVQDILTRTVNDEEGTAKAYRIPECKVMGKTGTTELAADGTYETGRTISSFICAMPADDPQVIVYYCFQGAYNPDAHVETEAMTNFMRKVAMTYGFVDKDNTAAPVEETGEETLVEIHKNEMPNLLNHSLTFAQEKLQSIGADVVILGDGNTVIDQYPRTSSTVMTGQRVFLLTDTSSFVMPDMTGWTRKDVTALWAVTGFGFQLQGEGIVTKQSVPAGTVVNKGTSIKVTFES